MEIMKNQLNEKNYKQKKMFFISDKMVIREKVLSSFYLNKQILIKRKNLSKEYKLLIEFNSKDLLPFDEDFIDSEYNISNINLINEDVVEVLCTKNNLELKEEKTYWFSFNIPSKCDDIELFIKNMCLINKNKNEINKKENIKYFKKHILKNKIKNF